MHLRRLATIPLAMLIAACGAAPTPTPSPTASPTPTAETIVIALALPSFATSPFFHMSNGMGGFRPRSGPDFTQLIYNGLYRYDDTLSPVPDLAARPCDVAADQVTITCRLVETTFHNGTPMTADDVVFTYELGRRSPECLFARASVCFGEMLDTVRAVDTHTVEFVLTSPNVTFLTLVLPTVAIDSKAVVEEAYGRFSAHASSLVVADFRAVQDAIMVQLGSETPDCEAPMASAEALLTSAGVEPLSRDLFLDADGVLNSCMYADSTNTLLGNLADSLESSGLEAIAIAYPALSFNRSPVGTGPWRFVSIEGGTKATLEAFEGYHFGPPATPRVEVRVVRDLDQVRAGLLSGELDWVPLPPDMYAGLKDAPDLQFPAFPDSTYFMLTYNLREGMLFADVALRTAVELCIDKTSTVESATDGTGDVIYSPIDPISWAYQPDLAPVERNVTEARRLIETAGWAEDEDGIYERDGVRLATEVYVRGDDAPRVAFMDLVAAQVRDCGIEFTVVPADLETVLFPLAEYPHVPAGHDTPFQALFIGWLHGYDPHDRLWSSSTVTSEEQPFEDNFMGFSDPEIDRLLEAGITTYDKRERARIYRTFQQELAQKRPVLFGWARRLHEALDARLGSTDGELNLASPQWFWQLEKLVLRDDGAG